ncbi:MAG: right-handed parallel beta-helix repeat-containing protein [Bacteroidetes bacterium]|nr:right-handed parallel beta-helix repeat-containing protein [Bacteroidota bacterium]
MRTRYLIFNLRLSTFSVFLTILTLMTACNKERDLQSMIDQAIASGSPSLVLPNGHYVLDEAVVLDGVENFTIRAENYGLAIVTSALRLSLSDFDCLDEEKRIYEIKLKDLITEDWPDSFRGSAGWPEVYVSGVPMHIARWPNEGWVKIDSVLERGSIPRQEDSTGIGGRFRSEKLAMNLIQGPMSKVQGPDSRIPNPEFPLFLSGYWCYKWYDETLRVESINSETGEIAMAAPHRYGIGGPSGGLFYGINHPSFLDEQMEYYYDNRTGTIRLILPASASSDISIEIAYKSFPLFDIRNCSNITVEDMELSAHNGLAVLINDSDSVELKACAFYRLSKNAVEIYGGTNCGVNRSDLNYLGERGVRIEAGDRETLTPANHYVTNSIIRNFALHVKTYAPAVSLLGVGHIVSYNEISDAPHNAILFSGNDHLIERNDIRRVCMNTSDAGAIYCGRDWTMGGTVIQHNNFKDLGQASHHHNWAIYLDDLASGIDVLNNVIEDCPSGILIGGGRYNRIIGNKMSNCPKASIMYDGRGLNWYTQYIDDPDNELWQRLRAMPIDQEPWKDRFPWLQDIPDDAPGTPKYATILNNEIVNSANPVVHPAVKKYGHVEY